eukprot:1541847-Rhodomonas_salina.1
MKGESNPSLSSAESKLVSDRADRPPFQLVASDSNLPTFGPLGRGPVYELARRAGRQKKSRSPPARCGPPFSRKWWCGPGIPCCAAGAKRRASPGSTPPHTWPVPGVAYRASRV